MIITYLSFSKVMKFIIKKEFRALCNKYHHSNYLPLVIVNYCIGYS